MAILSNSGRVAYGIKRYMVRTVEDILTIPLTPTIRPGSTVFVTSDQSRYILDQDYNWVQLSSGLDNGGSGGGDDDTGDGHIIYEGGDISGEVSQSSSDYEDGQI